MNRRGLFLRSLGATATVVAAPVTAVASRAGPPAATKAQTAADFAQKFAINRQLEQTQRLVGLLQEQVPQVLRSGTILPRGWGVQMGKIGRRA